MVSLEGGRTRKIEWPENTLFCVDPGANRDAILRGVSELRSARSVT
jgi:hypothetical protein